jgi:hypothetical protein
MDGKWFEIKYHRTTEFELSEQERGQVEIVASDIESVGKFPTDAYAVVVNGVPYANRVTLAVAVFHSEDGKMLAFTRGRGTSKLYEVTRAMLARGRESAASELHRHDGVVLRESAILNWFASFYQDDTARSISSAKARLAAMFKEA